MSRLFSPRDLATALGVSESSLKRWIDAGRIRATRTSGGHRRVTLADAIAFVRDSNTPVLHPELLGLSPQAAQAIDDRRDDEPDRTFYEALVAGDRRGVQDWVDRRRAEGTPLTALCDGPIRDAMHAIGELWQHDADGVFVEHRATDLCVQALARLRSTIDPPDDGPIALGCGPEDDPYIIPSSMAALVLASEGYRTINLGPDTPTGALHRAVQAHHPALVWISVSAPLPLSQAAEIADFVKSLPPRTLALVGGRNQHTIAEADRDVPLASSMAQLAALARGARQAA